MSDKKTSQMLREKVQEAQVALRKAWATMLARGPSQFQFWLIALLIGIAAGFAALFFRKAINGLQRFVYGTDDVHRLHSFALELPWYWVMLVPVLGGLIVGIILHKLTPDARARSVADVIEGAALHDGRVETKAGLGSALASLVTLGMGGSSGREGPVVHMAAVISTWVSDKIKANGITGRDLLGCAVAAAVSASFNAPIAGALFALEVILRHFAVHAFAPIAIASVAGTIINRIEFDETAEYALPLANTLEFYVELPAFLLLGLLCGLIATALMHAIFFADDMANHVQNRLRVPRWLRPTIAGLLLGIIAIWFPHIIGVGYETTSAALTGELLLWEAIVFCALKVLAVAITIGGRMGGGVFSPSLMIGALTGLAFGLIATGIFPQVSGSHTLYALAGLGAVAAAVLGAPISTTLIVFELTGDWQTGLAVLVAVSMSTALASRLVERSFFLTQLERRGVHLAAGPQAYLLALHRVAKLARPIGGETSPTEEACWGLIEDGIYIDGNTTLEAAMPIFERTNISYIPVVTLVGEGEPAELWGTLHQVDALRAFNKSLAEVSAEEHS
ncbi:H(+)/Cl(-) exchange transporter ClcA [Roseovarius albus]|uniref:H(+)/Cl(-) exchange transporter ClcA n=1 Tax=Roseovarius albus TaxID=1247867 RepID=A0A1X6YZA7_9RHOB|nr:chloride channel protein [Roseovarius albus]SLN35251.1 H(+)/Cl(-) exchange transporter ClcA [Roseovarius albus]